MADDDVFAVRIEINGAEHEDIVASRQLLVHYLRDRLGMKGTHIGCDTGNCGACTVICDGKAVKSCMMLAAQADGCRIETVEGLAHDDQLSSLQQAFADQHGLQCGYCTPGMLMSVAALLRERQGLQEAEIRQALKGNLCRCTGYHNIIRAVQAADQAGGRHG